MTLGDKHAGEGGGPPSRHECRGSSRLRYLRHYRGAGESVATGDGAIGGFVSRVKGVGERHIRMMIASGTSSHARLASSTIRKCGAACGPANSSPRMMVTLVSMTAL